MAVIAAHEVTRFAAPGRRRTRVIGLGTVLLVVGLLAVLGWSQWQHPSPGTTASARVTAPVSGVFVVEGGPPTVVPPPANRTPQPSVVIRVSGTTTAGLHVNRHLLTDSHGRFKLHLAPGRYVVAAMVYGGVTSLTQEPHSTIVVRRGEPVHVRIVETVS